MPSVSAPPRAQLSLRASAAVRLIIRMHGEDAVRDARRAEVEGGMKKARVMSQEDRIDELEACVALLSRTLGTLISWMGQSANSPLRRDECEDLIDMLPEPPK